MYNPFVYRSDDGKVRYLTSQCSVNKLILSKLPVYGLDDSAEGRAVSEVFSMHALLDEIEKNRERLKLSPEIQGQETVRALQNQLEEQRRKNVLDSPAFDIIKKMGYRLGLILLTLKQGEKENRRSRADWTAEHWEYWRSIKTVILGGGLTSGILGELLVEYTKEVFAQANVEPYRLVVFENATNVGVMGCTKLISAPSGWNIVMDFGQTNIKRSVIKRKNKEIEDMIALPGVPSKYMRWNIENKHELRDETQALHKYLINTVVDTYNSAGQADELNDEIIISIASYTVGGVLNDARGGYAKLSAIAPNYAECLSEEVSSRLKRLVRVKLLHDGTAVALHFSDYKQAVCLTLGTFFGVGFPDIFS